MLKFSFKFMLGRVDVSFPTTSQTLPSCDFQVFVSRYENETSTRPKLTAESLWDSFYYKDNSIMS
ncbi:MAG: hypothetical protein R3B45_14050 [Bdellovibrionota bacterium]